MSEDPIVKKMTEAFRRVLSDGLDGGDAQRTILVKRIPIICNDILEIKSDMRWIKWLVMGLIAGIGLIIVAVIGASITLK